MPGFRRRWLASHTGRRRGRVSQKGTARRPCHWAERVPDTFERKQGNLELTERQWGGNIRDKHSSLGRPLGRGKMFEQNARVTPECSPVSGRRKPESALSPALPSAASNLCAPRSLHFKDNSLLFYLSFIFFFSFPGADEAMEASNHLLYFNPKLRSHLLYFNPKLRASDSILHP